MTNAGDLLLNVITEDKNFVRKPRDTTPWRIMPPSRINSAERPDIIQLWLQITLPP
jgi:hypothetical protein